MAGSEFLKIKEGIFTGLHITGVRLSGLRWVILTAMSLLMAAHLHYRSPDFPYSPDSAGYIEQARNLVNSGSTLTTPYGLSPGNSDQVENRLFPIGYATVLASISLLGFDAKDVAVGVGHWSAMLLPWLVYFCFRNALGLRYGLVVAGLSLISPSVLINSPMGLTDVFALALAVGAIGLVLNSRSTLGFIFGGILAGMAYAVRNAQLALLIAVALYFCYLWFASNPIERRTLYKNAASLFLGASIIVVPVFIRNIYLFGTLNPYQMPPSTVGFIENLRTYIEALIKDATACGGCANYIAWSVPGLLALAVLVSCLCWLFIKYAWRDLEAAGKKAVVISATYILVGSCIVIAARTRYQWGELISIRHTLQYTPFLLAILLVPAFGSSVGSDAKWLQKLKLVLVVVLAFFHINYALFSKTFRVDNNYSILLSAYKTGEKHLCVSENDTFLVSNWAHVFRIECGAHVRQIEPVNIVRSEGRPVLMAANEGYGGLAAAIVDIKNSSVDRPVHIGFFPGRFGLEARDFPLPNAEQQKLLDSGWAVIRNDEQGFLAQYSKKYD